MTEVSHVAFGWCHSQEMWKNAASAELHSCSVKRGVGLLLQYLFYLRNTLPTASSSCDVKFTFWDKDPNGYGCLVPVE